ncbi:MAG TPA: PLP-dependent aspartate aminotransferase family protein [Gemmatimonadaceae bacterium]|nr:PLP-dependent aspartate aminotransferase family protein [Gemmatimonadaceae bacterium]HRQ79070.1 PLP-dependent aspartate aminotransferase family protein [Gemmatimonadaceae bacterium]
MPKPKKPSLATLAIHGAREAHQHGDAVVEPLVQSVNHLQRPGTGDGLLYTRYGNTPNAARVQKRLAMLEGAESALLLSSGMAATACALLALLRPGDHLLSSQFIYGGTHRLFMEEFVRMGIDVQLVDPWEPRVWRKNIRKETRAIFLETPVNPTCRVLDLRPISFLTRNSGIALVIDSTFASPINFRPLEHGADVVIHSATKYLNGHHDILMGAVLGSEPYIDEVLQKEMLWGQTPDPFACWLLERGLKTLDVRVKRANESALAIAQWAEKRKEIVQVHYPGLKSHPDHEVAKDVLDGFGGMLALELKGGGKSADRFLKKLKLVTHAPSLGGVDTLVSEPRFTSHAKMTPAERAAIGIPDGFLRFSIGLESVDDLIADLEQALK